MEDKMIKTEELKALREKSNVSECLRLLMISKDIKPVDLANALRVTPTYINAIMNNAKVPSIRLIEDFLKYFDISFDDFSFLVDYYNTYTGEAKFENALYETLKLLLNKEE